MFSRQIAESRKNHARFCVFVAFRRIYDFCCLSQNLCENLLYKCAFE
ncbi:hypothetical protein ACWIUD_06510 [Helicobacter sp. 23-1044]